MKLVRKTYSRYIGKVYDLEVDTIDHSYIINNKVVHNSAGGCLIAYLLDIVQIDPLQYDLLFERFLNKGRLPKYKNYYKVVHEDGSDSLYEEGSLVLTNNGLTLIEEIKTDDYISN